MSQRENIADRIGSIGSVGPIDCADDPMGGVDDVSDGAK
jgi:hypothetical protein